MIINLHIVYDKRETGLHTVFSSDSQIYDYINTNIEMALMEAIDKVDSVNYCLNIASTEDFGYFKWKDNRTLFDRQIKIFQPIIDKFIFEMLQEKEQQ